MSPGPRGTPFANGAMDVTLSAGVFSYSDSGGSRDPVALLHAMGRSAADWQPVFDRV